MPKYKTFLCQAGLFFGLALLLWQTPSVLAQGIGFTVSPNVISNTYNGPITFQITGLTNGATVIVQKYLDANSNGVVDVGDVLFQQFQLTDGQGPPVIAGVTNSNVPGDLNSTSGVITATINSAAGGVEQLISAQFVYVLSSPTGAFAPRTYVCDVSNTPYAQSFNGTVTSNGTNVPVPFAVVWLAVPSSSGDDLNPLHGTVADINGNYSIPAAPGTYQLLSFASNFVANLGTAPVLTISNANITTGLILSNATATISGSFVDATNSSIGLPGVLLAAKIKNGPVGFGVTDSNGNFILPALQSNQFEIGSEQEALGVHGYVGFNNNTTVTVTNANVAGVTIAFPQATALIYGSVTDTNNNPLPGIRIEGDNGNNNSGLYQGESVTDQNGNYVIGVVAANWSANIDNIDPFYANYVFSDGPSWTYNNSGSGTNIAAGIAVPANFTAILATNQIFGLVLDDNDDPITNIEVNANITISNVNYQAQNARTDINGYYSLDVFSGDWNVNINCSCSDGTCLGTNYLCPGSQNAVIANNNQEVDFTAPIAAFQITGYVTDVNSNPIVNVGVSASATIGTNVYNQYTDTDTNGYYVLGVANGTWDVSVNCNSGSDSLNSLGYRCVGDQLVGISEANGSADFTAQPLGGLSYSNLVVNGGFETDDFTGWNVSGNSDGVQVNSGDSAAHSGDFGAQFGLEEGGISFLSQTLATTPGTTYLISFWLDSPDGLTPNEFSASWMGQTLMDDSDIPAIGWTNMQFVVTTTCANTVLKFGGLDNPGFLYLDDVDVETNFIQFTATPALTAALTPVQFNSPSTNSLGNAITNWFWSFGDGATSTNQNTSHIYGTNGAYYPTLQATNDLGAAVACFGPAVIVQPPTIQITATPTAGAPPLMVSYTSPNMDFYGNVITNWFWDFGDDDGTSTNQSPSYTYNNTGSFTATLTTMDTSGLQTTSYGPIISVAAYEGLVLNGGFETGDFTGWTLYGDYANTLADDDGDVSGITPHGGSRYLAALQTVEDPGYISQTIATGPGTNYTLSFWLNVPAEQTPNYFQASWNGNTVFNVTNIATGGWTNVLIPVTATQTSTDLEFEFIENNGYIGLDDVDIEVTNTYVFNGGNGLVAVYGAPATASWNDDVTNKIFNTSLFSEVDGFLANETTPTLSQLLQYSAVLVYSDATFADSVGLGNVLADYVDAGGGVVVATFALDTEDYGLQGRLVTDGYLPVNFGTEIEDTEGTLVADQPSHPILNGVTSFDGGASSFHESATIGAGGTLVAHWTDGTPLVATKQQTAGRVVALNIYPPSSDARSDFWTASTDGGLLMANSLLWAGHGTSVYITSPANGASFTTNQHFTFSASANSTNGVQTLALYTNSVLVTSMASSNASIVLSNLAIGEYNLTAVATLSNSLSITSGVVSITVNALGTSLIDFDPLAVDGSVVSGTILSNYLAGFGITVTNATSGMRLEAASSNGFPGNVLPVPTSPPNLLTQVGSGQSNTFTLSFASNLESIVFSRVGLVTNGASFVSHPAWTAHILDASGNDLESVGEPLIFSSNNVPSRTFYLTGTNTGAANIAGVRFDSDSQNTAAFAAVLLDDLLLNGPATNPFTISLTSPGGTSFTAGANIALSATATDSSTNIAYMAFYSGSALIGSTNNPPYNITWSNVLYGTYVVRAQVVDVSGYGEFSAPITITVGAGPNSSVINFDSLSAGGGPVANLALSNYLANNGVTLETNSPGTTVEVESQGNVAGGQFVIASSAPNLLTQAGSNGPVSFTVSFSSLLTNFSFTRPALLPNPLVAVTHPAWQVQAFDALGLPLPLAATNAPQVSLSAGATAGVPAQTYALNGAGIASVEFSSESSGFTTVNGMLLDDFILTTNTGVLPPSILISSPTNGQAVTASSLVTINVETVAGSGTVTNVAYYNGTNLITNTVSSSIVWQAPSNGVYALTAVAFNSSDLTSTSSIVNVTVANGFAFLTLPPAVQTVGESNGVSFSVTTSTNGVSYQWSVNGAPLSGQTNKTLNIASAQLSDNGNFYSVVATAGGESITSPPAELLVLAPPIVAAILQSPTNINIGDTVTLSESTTNNPPYSYQWQLNGTSIPGATSNVYTISNAQPFNSGNYQVIVGNAVAYAESPTFNVAVNIGTNLPSTSNDTLATSLAFSPLAGPVAGINSNSPATDNNVSTIVGKPAGNFLWFNWTASFTGSISLTTQGSSFDTLMGVYTTNTGSLVSVAENDDFPGGYFTSLVTFNCQSNTTYQIAVAGFKGAVGTVILGLPPGTGSNPGQSVPVITTQPVSQIVTPGATVTLSVTASNATSYQWYFAGNPVAGVNTNILTITNFQPGAAGIYYGQAANAAGSVQSSSVVLEENQSDAINNYAVDKFGDAVDLTGGKVPEHHQPKDSGGDVGGFTLSQSFSTVGATKEVGEQNHAGQPGGASYWYTYTATGNGSLTFNTFGSTFNTILAIYTGSGASFASLTPVGTPVGGAYVTNYPLQGQPVIQVENVSNGDKFYIAVDGYQGASGAANLNVIFTNNNIVLSTNAVSITNASQTIVTITSPANDSLFLTTQSNITVKGTIRGSGGAAPVTNVQVTVNTNAPAPATIGTITTAPVLVTGPGGIEEEVAQQIVTWTFNLTLTNGANVVTAQSVSAINSNLATVSLPATRTFFYAATPPSTQDKSTLTLQTAGNGRIVGQPNHANLEINKVYKVTAVPIGNSIFTNWTSGTNTVSLLPNTPTLAFLMTTNLTLTANFITNPFPAFAGVYNGLFSPTNGVTEESSGFLTTTIPASSRGAYSARVQLDGGTYPFSGTFNLAGDAEQSVLRSGKAPLVVNLHLNLATNDDQITGSVNNYETNGWNSILLANRTVNGTDAAPSLTGRYTMVIPPGTNGPGGYGYATLNDPAGRVTVSGRLGDGTAISQSVPVAANGNIPLYVSLYSRQGSLLGWLSLTNNGTNKTVIGTNLTWIKISSRTGLYRGGFTNTNITVLGSLYVPPAAGAGALTLTNSATLTISNSSLIYSNIVTLAGDKLTGPDLKGTIAPSTGILTLSFQAAGVNTVAKGVILQDSSPTNAAGYFLDPTQSGYFLLQQ